MLNNQAEISTSGTRAFQMWAHGVVCYTGKDLYNAKSTKNALFITLDLHAAYTWLNSGKIPERKEWIH